MMQYCNAYSCATNKKADEVGINLSQRYPDIQPNGEVTRDNIEILASIVLRSDMAKKLAQDLLEILSSFDG